MKASRTLTMNIDMARFIKKLAEKEKRSVNSEINFLLEEKLRELGYFPSGDRS